MCESDRSHQQGNITPCLHKNGKYENEKTNCHKAAAWVNYRGFNSLAIETQLHASSHVFFMYFLNKVLSLPLPKNSVYSYIFTSWAAVSCLATWNLQVQTEVTSPSYSLLFHIIFIFYESCSISHQIVALDNLKLLTKFLLLNAVLQ